MTGEAATWSSLPPAMREEVDDLLCRHEWFRATVLLARSGNLALAQELVAHRQEVLYAQGRIPPEPETTVAELLDRVAALATAPAAIEACWDGDSRGWLVDLVAVLPGSGPGFDEVTLAVLHRRRDSDTTPAEEALTKGRAVAERLGVPFHFHDPEHPGIGHPRWWDARD
jgi:hypothetical protein